jgi:hypothetical protein
MATLTIIVTISSKTSIWTRTGTIEDVDHSIYRASDFQSSPSFGSEGGSGGIGIYSEDGIAALLCLSTGGGVARQGARDSANASIGEPMTISGMPLMLYAGSAGFLGAMKTSATATDVPDTDLDGVSTSVYCGNCSFTFLGAVKPIS